MSSNVQTDEIDSLTFRKIQILAFILGLIKSFTNKSLLVFFSAGLLISSYFLAPHFVGAALVTKAGTVVTIFGLLLSIKHSFVIPNSDAKKALETSETDDKRGFSLKWEGETYSLFNLEKTYYRLGDEVFGFGLIIVGTLFAAYGDLLPFYKLTPVNLCG